LGGPNTIIRLYRSEDQYIDGIVKYNFKTNEIFAPEPIPSFQESKTIDLSGVANYISRPFYEDSFDDWRLVPLINQTKVVEVSEAAKVTRMQWSSGKTFEDLQSLNLAFLSGFINETPYHFGPLDPESNIILKQLHLMNRLDMITYNSQPHESFPSYFKPNATVVQYPFVDFVFPRLKSADFNELLKKYIDFARITQIDPLNNKLEVIANPNPKYLVEGKLPFDIEYYNGQIKVNETRKITQYHDDVLLGENFKNLLQKDLIIYWIDSAKPDNELFSILAGLAKELI